MESAVNVHIDLNGKVYLVGYLWLHRRKNQETASFQYSKNWRSSPLCFALEPGLSLGPGKYHTDKSLFGAIGDSAPDRWGRNLIKRLELQEAKREKRPPRKMGEADYLLLVDDFSRQGALRFTMDDSNGYLTKYESAPIPPIIELPKLLRASDNLVSNVANEKDLKDLIAPGSSLGGARPKAAVCKGNTLLIAKFPNRYDDWDVPAWEYLSLCMAQKCGIKTPNFWLHSVKGRNVLLLQRFDRNKTLRIPFLSAMSMLEATDGEHRSYLDIAEAIISHGSMPEQDLKELWKRMVFNILVSNVDDHLRNHGFLFDTKSGWHLSPVYDLEPTPEHVKNRVLSTFITLDDGTASLELAFEVAEFFGVTLDDARETAKKICHITKDWHIEAKRLNIGKQEIDFMESAFDHDDLNLGLTESFFGPSM
jgi:serine/threonine-protein kinase HipA